VQTSLPLANSSMTTLGSAILYIRPGNCSGSYIVLPSEYAAFSRSIMPPRLAEATMFCIFSSGLLIIMIPPFLSSFITFITARRDSFSDFAPVQTIFPELKMSVAVLGLLSLKTRPGNCSGRYSTPG